MRMDILKVILTAILSVVSLFAIAKIMGHKQVAQLDFFDYISGITIGSIAAELATELEARLTHHHMQRDLALPGKYAYTPLADLLFRSKGDFLLTQRIPYNLSVIHILQKY